MTEKFIFLFYEIKIIINDKNNFDKIFFKFVGSISQ